MGEEVHIALKNKNRDRKYDRNIEANTNTHDYSNALTHLSHAYYRYRAITVGTPPLRFSIERLVIKLDFEK